MIIHLSSRRRSNRQHSRRNRGSIIVGVLACLLVGTVLTALTVQSALRGRREARLERQLAQTDWLCEGGIVRAVAALRKSTDYQGETWQPELGIEPLREAIVEIKVTADPSETKSWSIQVVARLDSTTDNDGPMQRSRTLTVKQLSESTQTSETNSNSEKSE